MNQFLKTEEKIIAWLNEMGVENYVLQPHSEYGFVVDVDGWVDLMDKKLKKIPIKFNVVKGSFHCNNNELKNLEGCPSMVKGNFSCDGNYLASLEHCPKEVGGYFSCDYNKLETLRHVPAIINGDFYCNENSLRNLEYCPKSIDGGFYCTSNPIDNLEFCPSTVKGGFHCSDTNLGETSKIANFNEIYKIHQTYLSIKAEQQLLSSVIKSHIKSDTSYKI